jgi:hypothetical protein
VVVRPLKLSRGLIRQIILISLGTATVVYGLVNKDPATIGFGAGLLGVPALIGDSGDDDD